MTVNIIGENGEERTVAEPNNPFAVRLPDGNEYLEPVVVDQIEVESDSNESTTGDMCGNVERETFGTQGLLFTITGIVTFSSRTGNLSVRKLLSLSEGDYITITSDFPQDGNIMVRNITVTQEQNLNSVRIPGKTNGDEKAVTFNLQLGEKSSES
jgi:hypothetical protein